MKTILQTILLLFTVTICLSQTEPVFVNHFINKTMRIDYFQTGDSDEMYFSIDQIYQQEIWAGNPKKLIDNLNSGMYYVKVYELATNKLIYSRGFATIFGEYKTTDDAKNNIKKTYHQTLLIPYPKSNILLVIEGRGVQNVLRPIYQTKIDPADVDIIREEPNPNDIVVNVLENGHPHDKVDFVFIAEGYTTNDLEKFKKDINRFTAVLFRTEPYKSNKNRFNISGVFRPSIDSGVDEPTKGLFRNTVVDAAYNALDTPRYLLLDNNKSLKDISSKVPSDAVIVISNINRYGGGGIYNDYTIFTADDDRSESIFKHEFGHGFGNLADEYFGGVAYNEFFPPGIEPHEPNITRFLDPENIKWKHLLTPGIPIPTPWGQDAMDSLRSEKAMYIKTVKSKISEIEKHGVSQKEIATLKNKIKEKSIFYDNQIAKIKKKYQEQYKGKVGLFEGAGYSPKGIYRSEVHIGMFYQGSYGPVSEEAILKMINHLSN